MDFSTDYTMTIAGKSVAGATTFDVLNPATERAFAQAPDCSREQLDDAVVAARRAQPAWSATPAEDRRAHVRAFGKMLTDNIEPISRLLTMEQGKSHADAREEILAAVEWMEAQAAIDIPVHVVEDSTERLIETRYVPIGVVAAIAPWNYPVALGFAFKMAPAIIAGNTVVLKPSPFTPLSTLKIGELAQDILPPGVLNIVSGGDALGPMLTEHPGIDKVTFTGSTQTGRRVMRSASATLKRLTLELGGNDAAIILEDADIEEIAEALFWSAFTNNGQLCVATKRLYAHAKVYDALASALVKYARSIRVGNGAEQGNQLGPINNRPQYERVLALIDDAQSHGYTFLLGGEKREGAGFFVPVTIIDNPPEESRIVREEQFGPVLPLIKFDDVEDVIRLANDSEYGLAGSVWGSDEKAVEIARRLETGTVFINNAQHMSPFAAFGGHKQSGIGVEGGVEGLLEFTNTQTIVRAKVIADAPG